MTKKLTKDEIEFIEKADMLGIDIYKTQRAVEISKLSGEMVHGGLNENTDLVKDQGLYDYEETVDVDDYAEFEVEDDNKDYDEEGLSQEQMLDVLRKLIKEHENE